MLFVFLGAGGGGGKSGDAAVMAALKKHFTPEFLNRLDKVGRAAGETAILAIARTPLYSVAGVSIVMERERQQNCPHSFVATIATPTKG